MTPDTEVLLWRRFNAWFRSRRPDYPSEWDAYQAGHADGVADERERCAQLCDKLSRRAGDAMDCRDAIRAGAPPDTLREAARGIRWSDQ